jgi:RNAse (barnase) inhibitor barstar
MFKTQRSDESAMTDTQAPAVVESAVVKMDDAEWEKLGEYVKAECSKMIEPYEARIKAIEEKIGQTEESTEATAQAVAEVEKNFESKLDMVVTSIQKALNVTTAPNAQPGVTPEPAQHESQKSLWPTGINRAINSAAKARN